MKKRRKTLKGHPGIYGVEVFDVVTGKWREPERGAKYEAYRLAKGADGKPKREWRYFEEFKQAKGFRGWKTGAGPAVAAPAENGPVAGGMTFTELKADWRANWLPNKDLPTQIRYDSYLQHFAFFDQMLVENVKASDVDSWITAIKKPEYLARFHSTRCNYEHEYTVLRSIFRYYATRHNRNFALPFLSDHKAMLKVKDKPKRVKDLTVEEFRRFMIQLRRNVFGTVWEVIYYLAMMQYLGYFRVQESAALRYEDFDFATGKLRACQRVQWLRKKGFEDRIKPGLKAAPSKEIDMPALAAQFFREWVMKSGVRSGLLFTYEGGIVPYRVIEHAYNKALKGAELPFTATHIIRHAALTEYYAHSKDLLATAAVAGHSDLESTQRYAKVRNESLAKNQRVMDEKLSSLATLKKE